MDIYSLSPIIPSVEELPYARPGRYVGNRFDGKVGVRTSIIGQIDKLLVLSFNTTAKKKFNEALFIFYHGLFPKAIATIAKAENSNKKPLTKMTAKEVIANAETRKEYRRTLVKEFFQRMNAQVEPAIEYIVRQLHRPKIEEDKLIIPMDDLVTDIQNSRRALYKGKTTVIDPDIVKLHQICKIPLTEGYAGTDYREQILHYVSLIWRFYLIHYVVYMEKGLFTIPPHRQVENTGPNDNRNSKTKELPVISKLTETSFTDWCFEPLDNKIKPIGVTFRDIVDRVTRRFAARDHHV